MSRILDYFEASFNISNTSNTMPSQAIPLEIQRWQAYKKYIKRMNRKELYDNRQVLKQLLYGPTHPIAYAYELHPNRVVELNPTYDIKTKEFILWDNIRLNVEGIFYGERENLSPLQVKPGIIVTVDNLLTKLSSINLQAEDKKVSIFERRLSAKRTGLIKHCITKRKNYRHITLGEMKIDI